MKIIKTFFSDHLARYQMESSSHINPYPARLIVWVLKHLKLCLAIAIHKLKWLKNTHICLIWNQTFTNLDV